MLCEKRNVLRTFFYTPSTVRLGDLECFPGSNLYIFCLVFDLLKFFVNYEKNQQNKTVSATDLVYFMLFKYLQGSSPRIPCGHGDTVWVYSPVRPKAQLSPHRREWSGWRRLASSLPDPSFFSLQYEAVEEDDPQSLFQHPISTLTGGVWGYFHDLLRWRLKENARTCRTSAPD